MKTLPLYIGNMLRLTPLYAEKDAPVASGWTYEPVTAAKFREGPPNPLSVYEVRKLFEGWIKDADEKERDFVFAFRPRVDERMVGFLRVAHVQWVHGAGMIYLVIGNPQDWSDYGREAVDMALNFAFDELNLFRVSVRVSEDDRSFGQVLREANFSLEVRQRQASYRDGHFVDLLIYGMLRPEWQVFRPVEVA